MADDREGREHQHPHRGSQHLPGRTTEYDPEKPDFADEHNSVTLAGEVPGGLEHVREPESPRGLAGMEPEE